jgi:hypothetical protein
MVMAMQIGYERHIQTYRQPGIWTSYIKTPAGQIKRGRIIITRRFSGS